MLCDNLNVLYAGTLEKLSELEDGCECRLRVRTDEDRILVTECFDGLPHPFSELLDRHWVVVEGVADGSGRRRNFDHDDALGSGARNQHRAEQ